MLPARKRAPTLYAIIGIKLLKGLLFLSAALVVFTLSDNDLPQDYLNLLQWLRLNPEKKFFSDLAVQVGRITQTNVLWVSAGTLVYSMFSLVEAVGLMFRVGWAGWMAVGESAFFVPIEAYELIRNYSATVLIIMLINIWILWYLICNRHRLFRHQHLFRNREEKMAEPESP